jgi:phosphatidylglycerophosphatase C
VKKKIAFFDFDGTITTKDTLLEFIKFSKGVFPFYLGFILYSPYLVAYKLKIIPNQKAKEKVLGYFFRDTSIEDFKKLCEHFSKQVLPNLIRRGAIEEIQRLKAENYSVVIVSASPQNWIQDWAQAQGAELIASCLEVNNGKLTGRLDGNNCYGQEKVRRITEKFIMEEYETIYAYGDTSGDLPMLKLATQAHYKPFR